MNWKIGVAVALGLLIGLFALQNTQVVEVRLFFWKVEMSRALMLFGVLGTGFFAGWLLGTLQRR